MNNGWDYSIFWQETLNQVREQVSEQEWVMWFNNIHYNHSTQNTIVIDVPSSFYRDQVKQRYLPLLESTLFQLCGTQIQLDFSIQAKKREDKPRASIYVQPASEPVTIRDSVVENNEPKMQQRPTMPVKQPQKTVKQKPRNNLRDDYIFDNYIIGENNSFAANAAIAISKNPGTTYNPCLIYGGVGLGKTHLIQAIGNAACMEFDHIKVEYITAEQFTNEFIEAIRDKKTQDFKNKYRNVDILLIDDIHFLQNKDSTQEELFHTFNALYDADKQMIFTCDRPVSELKNMTDRLRSRFERGLNVDLTPPSVETRIAILKKKVQVSKKNIPDETIELIANNITTNVRDLEAALTKLIAYADLVNKNITTEIAQQQLKDVFSNPRQSNISIELIQRIVSDYFNLSANDLRGKKRTKAIVFPRQLAMYICREITEYSTTEVGKEFGGRDHTTVMHACQRIETRMRTDSTLEPTIQQLIRQIKDSSTR